MLDIRESQVLWIFGAMERLATLGLLQPTPYQVSQKAIDIFLVLDESRDSLFSSDNEMKELLSVLLKAENGLEDKELLENMFVLVKDYKNDREKIVKFALSHKQI